MPWNEAVKEANRRFKAQEKKEWGRSWSQASHRDWSQARGRSQNQTWQRGRSQSQSWEVPQPEQPDTAQHDNAAASSSSSSGDPRLTALASFYESQASLIRNLGGSASAPK